MFLNFERCYILHCGTLLIGCVRNITMGESKGEHEKARDWETRAGGNWKMYVKWGNIYKIQILKYRTRNLLLHFSQAFTAIIVSNSGSANVMSVFKTFANIKTQTQTHTHSTHMRLVPSLSLACYSLTHAVSESFIHPRKSMAERKPFRSFSPYTNSSSKSLESFRPSRYRPSHLQWIRYLFDCGNASIFHYLHSSRQ